MSRVEVYVCAVTVLVLVLSSCTVKNPAFCANDTECAAGTSCDLDLNTCFDDPDADTTPRISLTVDGNGTGTVTSTPAGINCGALCEAVFPQDSAVTLNPLPGVGSVLVEWGGDCAGYAPCALTASGPRDVTASFGLIGEHLWSEAFDAGDGDVGLAATFDDGGNLIVVGTYGGTMNFGGDPLVSDSLSLDIFVAKLDGQGNHIWSKGFGGAGNDIATSVAVDGDGNVVVGAMLNTDFVVNFEPGPTTELQVLRLLAADGTLDWSKTLSVTSGEAILRAVGADSMGDVVVGGDFTGTLDAVGDQITNGDAETDIFLAWYGPTGALIRVLDYGNSGREHLYGLAMDDASNTYAVGDFTGSVGFGSSSVDTNGGFDGFLVRFGSTGLSPWAVAIGGPNSDEAFSVGVDKSGNVYVTGNFRDTVDFGGGDETAVGQQDIYVASYNSGGDYRWATTFGSDEGAVAIPEETVWDLAVRERDHVAVIGWIIQAADFGGGVLPSNGQSTMFVADFDSGDGTHRWSRTFGVDALVVVGKAIAMYNVGRVAATGMINGPVGFGGTELTGDGAVFVAVFGP
jgi:hypothetical protein